jgi:aminoglycoside phosphotransferase (APT) family kinase protein
VTEVETGIPSSIEEVTPGWLSAVLGHTVTGARAERIAQDSGFASLLYRVWLTGGTGLPETVVVKLPGSQEARGAMELLGGYRRELEFYRRIAGRAPMGTAGVFVAESGSSASEFVLVMEDLRGWDNADHLAGLTMDQARSALSGLAGLHAWSATNPVPAGVFPGLDFPAVRQVFLPVFATAWAAYLERTRITVPPGVTDFAARFAELAPVALETLSRRPTLLHGDIRADNLFFRDGAMKVVDFQFACHGAGAADVAYLVTQGLPVSERRGRDQALLTEYLDDLAAQGDSDYPFDEAWRDYRLATGYLMMLPVISLLGAEAMPERSRQLCITLTDRAVAAIDEIDAVAAFS